METTKKKLEKLDIILNEKNAPIQRYFNHGLSRQEVVDFFNSRGILASDSLIALYEWHNGVDVTRFHVRQSLIQMFPMGIFCTLDFMMERRSQIIEDLDYLQLGDLHQYLPLFSGGEDNLFLYKISTGEIFYISPIIQILGELEFKSIDTMLDCLIEAYLDGTFTIDQEIGLNANYFEFENKKEKYRDLS